MSANVLTPKELRATCNASLAVLDDLINDHPDLDDDTAEEAEDAQVRLQSIVDALETPDPRDARIAELEAALQAVKPWAFLLPTDVQEKLTEYRALFPTDREVALLRELWEYCDNYGEAADDSSVGAIRALNFAEPLKQLIQRLETK